MAKSFIWDNYLELAEKLSEPIEPMLADACYRSAISRAYYAVYIKASKYKGYNTKTARASHEDLIKLFKESDDSDEAYIGTLLDGLRKARNEADYDGFIQINKREADDAIIKAKEIIK